jgi:hypothetical protein
VPREPLATAAPHPLLPAYVLWQWQMPNGSREERAEGAAAHSPLARDGDREPQAKHPPRAAAPPPSGKGREGGGPRGATEFFL